MGLREYLVSPGSLEQVDNRELREQVDSLELEDSVESADSQVRQDSPGLLDSVVRRVRVAHPVLQARVEQVDLVALREFPGQVFKNLSQESE